MLVSMIRITQERRTASTVPSSRSGLYAGAHDSEAFGRRQLTVEPATGFILKIDLMLGCEL